MFEKKEDKLFDFAFGELDAHEAQVFEAGLLNDSESLAEIEFLRSMKEDIASLRDIPEMQYSKERLRSAILGQGLKPKKPIMPWINWLLAPSAVACVAALGFVLVNGVNHKEPQFVPSGKPMAMGVKPTIEMPKNNVTHPYVASRVNEDNGTPNTKVSSLAAPEPHRFHHSRGGGVSRRNFSVEAPTGKGADNSALGGSLKPGGTVDDNAKNAVNDLVAMSTPTSGDAFKVAFGNKSGKSDEDAKLIVIDKDQDSGVGAATATEVNSTGNVVIGG